MFISGVFKSVVESEEPQNDCFAIFYPRLLQEHLQFLIMFPKGVLKWRDRLIEPFLFRYRAHTSFFLSYFFFSSLSKMTFNRPTTQHMYMYNEKGNFNRSYSYSRYWTGAGLQMRQMWRVFSNANNIKRHCQLAHMRTRYHFIANLHITESRSVQYLTKYEKFKIIGGAKAD